MLKHQSSLPHLPVPDLKSTLDKYLRTIRPFVSDEKYQLTEELVQDFSQTIGVVLQERLLGRAKKSNEIPALEELNFLREDPKRDVDHVYQFKNEKEEASIAQIAPTKNNWLIDWWNHYSYLRYRESVVLNVSFFFVFKDDPLRRTQIERAASMLRSAMDFKQQVEALELAPDAIRNSPQCMQQYLFLFNTYRVPCKPADIVEVYQPNLYHHVLVIRRDHLFIVETKLRDGSRFKTVSELEADLLAVCEKVKELPPTLSVGALTSTDRDLWTTNYRRLRSHSYENAKSLERIHSAAFVLCLDETAPITNEEISKACWHNEGVNRWYDKALQLIVFENGRAGFLGEHSMFDATTPARFCDFVNEQSRMTYGSSSMKSSQPISLNYTPHCHHLTFNLPAQLRDSIPTILQSLRTLSSHQDLQVLQFQKHGKDFIKKMSMSPDSYVQMAIQLAYFKLMGTWAATYESAGMKKYAWGRTETCRSVSMESTLFLKTFSDKTASVEEKVEACRKAVQAHSQYMSECLQGKGIDRHLLGLRLCLNEGESVPLLFTDIAYYLSCHWTLSSSQIPSDEFDNYGWGEVVPDGFGVAYMVHEDHLTFNITGLVGEAVPDLEPGAVDVYGSYFVQHYKQLRVQWMRSFMEEALSEMHLVFTQAQVLKQHSTTSVGDQCVPQAAAEARPFPSSSPVAKDPVAGKNPISNSITTMNQTSPNDVKSIDSKSQIGFSLAYPSRTHAQEMSGVVGEDVGFLEWGERRRDLHSWLTGQQGLLRALREWNPLQPRHSGGGGGGGDGATK